MKGKIAFFLLVQLLFVHFGSLSQAGDSLPKARSGNRFRFLAVPTLGSAPETGFYFGAVALMDILPKGDSLARNSVFKTELTYTTKNQFVAGFEWFLNNRKKSWILTGTNYWTKFPELFWGIGGNVPKSAEVRYGANRFELANGLYYRVHSNWYFGVCQRFQSIYSPEFPQLSDKTTQTYSQLAFGISSGAGLGVLFDTRTNILNPKPGEVFLSVQTMSFGKVLLSDFSFFSADLDLRYYQKTSSKSLLALQVFAQMRSDGAPFRMMGMVGGPIILRGYYQGRFRDNQLVVSQLEWRWTFHRYFGFTTFAAAGNVYSFDFPDRSGSLKSAAGIGFRVIGDPKSNTFLRLDAAWSRNEDFGFYISFGEAF